MTAIGPGPMETPFFYGQESKESAQYNQTAAALSNFSKTGLTDPEDFIPIVRMLGSDGWWITGQPFLLTAATRPAKSAAGTLGTRALGCFCSQWNSMNALKGSLWVSLRLPYP